MTIRRTFPALIAFALLLSLTLLSDVPPAAGGVVFVVDTESDNLVGGDGDCTLREAVKATRENIIRADCGPTPGSSSTLDTINLPGAPIFGNTYEISIAGGGVDEGDFDLGGGPVLIQRTGAAGQISVVDANDLDRAFYVPPGGVATLDSFIVTDGTSPFDVGGGGILNYGILTLNTMRISSNVADAAGGGGIRSDGQLIVEDSTIIGNTANGGGGILNVGSMTVLDSTITGNDATPGDGGGILSFGSAGLDSVLIGRTTVSGNEAQSGGGIKYRGNGLQGEVLSIGNSTISANTAASSGGAISNGDNIPGSMSTMNLENVTISGNMAGQAAISNSNEDTLNIASVTAVNNTATFSLNHPDILHNQSIVNMKNTIFGTSDGSPVLCSGADPISQGHNIATTNDCGLAGPGDQVVADPLLGPLANNGGETLTHAILAGSPAIDRGDDSGCPAIDQREEPRPQGNACDVGAYESAFSATPAPTPTPVPTPEPTPTPTSTPTPEPTATLLPTETPGPSSTPTVTPPPTGGPKLAQGDVQCDGDVDTVDALQGLRDVAALQTFQEPDCPEIGGLLARRVSGQGNAIFGDVDCDGDVDTVDALKILRHVAALPVAQTEPCADIGEPLPQ